MPKPLAHPHRAARPLPLVAALTAAALAVASLAWVHHAQAAGQPVSPAPTSQSLAAAAPVDKSWQLLSAQEKAVLAPLATQWPGMNDQIREKWRSVARGYPKLTPDAQARVRERMTEWSQATPKERGEARLRFQNARELPPVDRQQKWQAYQALSPEAKAELAQQAQRKKANEPGSGPASSAQGGLSASNRKASDGDGANRKTNVVPAPNAMAPAAQVVAPALVRTGPGATTSLVTQSAPKPPLHQQAGMPKIAATKTFVDPQTMLPKKGSQGAAMTPVTASAASKATN